MSEILVLNEDLDLLTVSDNPLSFMPTTRYNEPSSFTMVCIASKENTEVLIEDNIVYMRGEKEGYYIDYVNIYKDDNDGLLKIKVSGPSLTNYLSRRILTSTERMNGLAEVEMRNLVNKHAINPEDSNRIIPKLTLGTLHGFEEKVSFERTYSNMLTTIKDIAKGTGLGFRIEVDLENKLLIFNVLKGKDRTKEQNENNRVIISSTYNNIKNQKYIKDKTKYLNSAIVAGQGVGENRRQVHINPDVIGLDRYEMYVDARDLSEVIQDEDGTEIEVSLEEYNNWLTQRGIEKLEESRIYKTFEATPIANVNFIYGKDYSVGDKITCEFEETGIVEDLQVIEVDEAFENNGHEVTLTLGDSRETIKELVDNVNDNFTATKLGLELSNESIRAKISTVESDTEELKEDYETDKEDINTRLTLNETEVQILSSEITNKVSQTEYDEDFNKLDTNYTEIKQQVDNITSSVQIGGGDNLIKNSVGYGGFNYWDNDGQNFTYGTSTWILNGTAKHGWIGSNGALGQNINLMLNTDYTLSGKIYKQTQAGNVKIILNDSESGEIIQEVFLKEAGEDFDGQFRFQFNSGNISNYRMVIHITDTSTSLPTEITDLMLAQGENYSIWSQAAGEVYTLNVRIDGKGITVHNIDGKGKTVMSPEEFAGYYNNQKIFTLNGDITEVMGLYVGGKGLFIPPVKFVQTDNSLDIVWTGVE